MSFELDNFLHENRTIINDTGWTRKNINETVFNLSLIEDKFDLEQRDALFVVIPVTIIYTLIFFTGVIGNISTCVVISRNKSMHTATNYYLFSLAVSDLLLLVSGLPPEMYHMWSPWIYVFGERFCFLQGLAAETSANASVLTITAFTVERYVAICHPFLSHTMSKLSRAIKFVIGIWILSLCLALPQAMQFGVVYDKIVDDEVIQSRCTIKKVLMQHLFEISTFVIFVGPMTVITALYMLIGLKLRRSRMLMVKRPVVPVGISNGAGGNPTTQHQARSFKNTSSQNHVIKMLVAVVVAFFICWAPFHSQRLLAVYITESLKDDQPPDQILVNFYSVLNYISGVLYFLSTTVNPVLYNIMSNKFRDAFKSTLAQLCDKSRRGHGISRRLTYSALSRGNNASLRTNHRCVMSEPPPVQHEPCQNNFHPSSETPALYKTAPDFNRQKSNSSNNDELWIQMHTSSTAPAHMWKTYVPRPNNLRRIKSTALSHGCSSRSVSESENQITVMTTVSKFNVPLHTPICTNKNEVAAIKRSTSFGIPLSQVVIKKKSKNVRKVPNLHHVNFGTIAQKLGFIFRPVSMNDDSDCERGFREFTAQESLDSGNTISNSSLQDLDETEFSSSDLARYMGELNQNFT